MSFIAFLTLCLSCVFLIDFLSVGDFSIIPFHCERAGFQFWNVGGINDLLPKHVPDSIPSVGLPLHDPQPNTMCTALYPSSVLMWIVPGALTYILRILGVGPGSLLILVPLLVFVSCVTYALMLWRLCFLWVSSEKANADSPPAA
jgi:hypothetical protein